MDRHSTVSMHGLSEWTQFLNIRKSMTRLAPPPTHRINGGTSGTNLTVNLCCHYSRISQDPQASDALIGMSDGSGEETERRHRVSRLRCGLWDGLAVSSKTSPTLRIKWQKPIYSSCFTVHTPDYIVVENTLDRTAVALILHERHRNWWYCR